MSLPTSILGSSFSMKETVGEWVGLRARRSVVFSVSAPGCWRRTLLTTIKNHHEIKPKNLFSSSLLRFIFRFSFRLWFWHRRLSRFKLQICTRAFEIASSGQGARSWGLFVCNLRTGHLWAVTLTTGPSDSSSVSRPPQAAARDRPSHLVTGWALPGLLWAEALLSALTSNKNKTFQCVCSHGPGAIPRCNPAQPRE